MMKFFQRKDLLMVDKVGGLLLFTRFLVVKKVWLVIHKLIQVSFNSIMVRFETIINFTV